MSREKGFELSGYYQTFQKNNKTYGSTVGQLFSFDLATLRQQIGVVEHSNPSLGRFRDYNLRGVAKSDPAEISFCTNRFCFVTQSKLESSSLKYFELGKDRRLTGDGFGTHLFFDESDFEYSGKLQVFDVSQCVWSEIDFSKLVTVSGEKIRYYYKRLASDRMLISYGMPERSIGREGDTVIVDLMEK